MTVTSRKWLGFSETGERNHCTAKNGNYNFGDDDFVIYTDMEL